MRTCVGSALPPPARNHGLGRACDASVAPAAAVAAVVAAVLAASPLIATSTSANLACTCATSSKFALQLLAFVEALGLAQHQFLLEGVDALVELGRGGSAEVGELLRARLGQGLRAATPPSVTRKAPRS